METGKMFQMKMRVKGGTGKPDERRENKVKGGDNDVMTNPMKDVRTKTLPTKKVFGSSV